MNRVLMGVLSISLLAPALSASGQINNATGAGGVQNPNANGGGGGTAPPIWVDPRSFGAKCDGTTDDTAALNTAAAATGTFGSPVQPWGLLIPNIGHACLTTTGIVMPVTSGLPVYIRAQGTLRATASQTSLISIGTSTAYVAGGGISGGGILDANGLAQNAVWVHQLEDFTVEGMIINNATVAGVRWGDQSLSSSLAFGGLTRNNIFMVYNLTATPPVPLTKTTGSIAEFIDNATDNTSQGNEERGYDIGVQAASGSNYVISDHCWGHSNQVPSQCFVNTGSGDFWLADYADGPSVYGFHMEGSRDTIIGPKVLCNQFCPTNTVVGIQFDQANPGSTVENGTFQGITSNILLSDLGGTTAALNSLRLGGNISGGFIGTLHSLNEQIPNDTQIKGALFTHYSGGTFPTFIADSQFGFPFFSGSVITYPSSGSNSAGNLWATDSNGNTTLINAPNTGATPATLDLSAWTTPQPPSTWIYGQITGKGQHVFNATNTTQPCTYDLRVSGTSVFCYNLAAHWVLSGPIDSTSFNIANGGFLGSMLATLTANRTYTFPDQSGTVGLALKGTTGTITGTSLTASCDSGTVTVTGAVAGQAVSVSSTTGADVGGAFNLRASVTAANTVSVFVCGTGTPASLAYNVVVHL